MSFLRSSTIIVISTSRFKFKFSTSPCSLGKKETWNHRDFKFAPRTMGAQRSLGPVDDGKFTLLFLNGTKDPRSFVYAYILTKEGEHAIKRLSAFLFAHRGTCYYVHVAWLGKRLEIFFAKIVSSVVNSNRGNCHARRCLFPMGILLAAFLEFRQLRSGIGAGTHRNSVAAISDNFRANAGQTGNWITLLPWQFVGLWCNSECDVIRGMRENRTARTKNPFLLLL